MKTPKVTYAWMGEYDGVTYGPYKSKMAAACVVGIKRVERVAIIPAAVAKTPAVQSALRVHAAKKKGQAKK
jgi:hypothetical protein